MALAVSILIGFPIGGYVADLVVDGVDSVGAAIAAGLITGAIIGAAEWLALRRRVSWLWIPAATAGMAAGLTAGAALRVRPAELLLSRSCFGNGGADQSIEE